MKTYTIRDGDVIVRRVPKIPEAAEKEAAKEVVLARGEVTGHAHRISGGEAALFRYDDKTYLRVTSPFATLTHEEHEALELPNGDYEVIIQREHTPEGWAYVAD